MSPRQAPLAAAPAAPKLFPLFSQPPAKKAAVAGGSGRPAAAPAPGLAAKPAQRRIVDLSEVGCGMLVMLKLACFCGCWPLLTAPSPPFPPNRPATSSLTDPIRHLSPHRATLMTS